MPLFRAIFYDYAPQLAVPGFGGRWEGIFDEMLAKSVAASLARRANKSNQGSALTTDAQTPLCEDNLALRHPTFGNYGAAHIACGFVQGNGAGVGPSIRAFDTFDYLIWILSEESSWLPEGHRSYLLEGMKDWGVWIMFGESPTNEALKPIPEAGQFSEQLFGALQDGSWKRFSLSREARADLTNRITAVRELLGLPESPESLLQKFLETDCIERWFNLPWQRRQRRQTTARTAKKSK